MAEHTMEFISLSCGVIQDSLEEAHPDLVISVNVHSSERDIVPTRATVHSGVWLSHVTIVSVYLAFNAVVSGDRLEELNHNEACI
jgi:hypothetical protein